MRAGEWDQHGHSELEPEKVSQDFAGFYFMSQGDANLFRWRWLPDR